MSESMNPAEKTAFVKQHAQAPIDRAMNYPNARPLGKLPIDETRIVPGPPIDFDPKALTGESPATVRGQAALEQLHTAWSLVREAAADRSVDLDDLAKGSQRVVEKSLVTCDRLGDQIENEITSIEGKIDSIIMPAIPDAMASEIRTFWQDRVGKRGKTDAFGTLMERVAEDPRTSSAILNAPHYLSSLKPDQYDLLRVSAIHSHAPVEEQLLKESNTARDRVRDASARLIKELGPRMASWGGTSSSALAKLREAGR